MYNPYIQMFKLPEMENIEERNKETMKVFFRQFGISELFYAPFLTMEQHNDFCCIIWDILLETGRDWSSYRLYRFVPSNSIENCVNIVAFDKYRIKAYGSLCKSKHRYLMKHDQNKRPYMQLVDSSQTEMGGKLYTLKEVEDSTERKLILADYNKYSDHA